MKVALIGACATAGSVCLGGLVAIPSEVVPVSLTTDSTAAWFEPLPPIPGDRFRDVDVTDIDGNGLLDIFAPAHAFEARLYRNTGGLTFSANEIAAYGLGQDADFPRWETGVPPVLGAPGLYVYRKLEGAPRDEANTSLNLVWHSTGTTVARVHLTFYAATTIEYQQNAGLSLTTGVDGEGRKIWTVSGKIQAGGQAALRPTETGLPIDVTVRRSVAAAQIYVGPDLVRPDRRTFTLRAKDRHGLAFADFMGDNLQDAFWAVGGAVDTAQLYEGLIDDEVFVNEGDVEVLLGPSSGVRKTTCRGYDARVVDGNGDDRLDLFLGCWKQHPMLWVQDSAGHFALDPLTGVAQTIYGTRWVDLDNDNAQELVGTAGTSVVIYERDANGSYQLSQSIPVSTGPGMSQSIQSADYDGDGYQDVFVPSKSGSVLLRNTNGVLARQALAPLALPATAIGAAWADVNSDGLLDLLVMPGGLYLQNPNGTFATTGVLAHLQPTYIASATFADLDNDGARDIVTNLETKIDYIARNVSPQGNWLQVNLVGPNGNANAIGAHVTATTGAEVQRHWIGESDTSLFSQGHYRLYFGLGAVSSIDKLTVRWPDGTVSTRTDVATDQMINISYP